MNQHAYYRGYTEGLEKLSFSEGPGPMGGRPTVHGRGAPGLRWQAAGLAPEGAATEAAGTPNIPSLLAGLSPADIGMLWEKLPLSSKLLLAGGGTALAAAGGLKGYQMLQKSRAKKEAVNPDIGKLVAGLA